MRRLGSSPRWCCLSEATELAQCGVGGGMGGGCLGSRGTAHGSPAAASAARRRRGISELEFGPWVMEMVNRNFSFGIGLLGRWCPRHCSPSRWRGWGGWHGPNGTQRSRYGMENLARCQDGKLGCGWALACVRGNVGALAVGWVSVAVASHGDMAQVPSA
jgi:hypothetical protein